MSQLSSSSSTPPTAKPPAYSLPPYRYTFAGLSVAIAWMIFADWASIIFQSVFNNAMPFQLQQEGLEAATINIIKKSIPVALSLFPIWMVIAYISDRLRTRWGRRIPFILASLIPTAILLVVMGFMREIADSLRSGFGSEAAVVWGIAVLVVLYQLFRMTIENAFFWLAGDVIPHYLLGRYAAIFRIGGVCGGVIYALAISPHIKTHSLLCYIIAAIVLVVGFGLPCFFLKEREYAPPPDVRYGEPWVRRFFHAFRNFFGQSFTHPIYLSFYAYSALIHITDLTMTFNIIFARDHLGLSLAQMGTVAGWVMIGSFVLILPMGWLVDKIHPMRATLIALCGLIPISVACFFMNSYFLYFFYFVVRMILKSLHDAARMPLAFRLYPVNQYAQLSTVSAFVRSIAVLFGTLGAAYFIQLMRDTLQLGYKGYAFIFLWAAFFQLLALGFFFFTFRLWKKHGGDDFIYEIDRGYRLEPGAPKV